MKLASRDRTPVCGTPPEVGSTLSSLNSNQAEHPFDEFSAWVRAIARIQDELRRKSSDVLCTDGPRSGKKMGEWGTETTRQTSIREWR